MQSELGEHADGYKYAPEVIEMMDSQYLNEFLDGIPNERLKKQWSDSAQGSGRKFVVLFQQEMDDTEVSFTSENTVQAKMQALSSPADSVRPRWSASTTSLTTTSCGTTHSR